MAKKATKKSVTSSKAVTQILQGPKSKEEAKEQAKKPAQSEQDWINQELNEMPPVTPDPDPVNAALNRKLYVRDYSQDSWTDKVLGRVKVTRWYPGDKAFAFDMPATVKEMQDKEAFFKARGIIYLAVAPNESLEQDQLRKRLATLFAQARKQNLATAA